MSILNLVELQAIDSQLEDLNSLLGDLPKMVEELNNQENSLKIKIEDAKINLKNVNLNTNKSETINTEIQEKINKLTDQLFLVTNNKQYDALTTEIEHLKDQKGEHETLIITYIEEKEELEKSISENETQLEGLKTDLDSRRKKLDEALLNTAEEKEALEKSRKEQVVMIDENTINIYNKVILARSGTAVVSLSGDSCGGCGSALTLQLASEIRAGNMHRCDSCGRFVYSKKK